MNSGDIYAGLQIVTPSTEIMQLADVYPYLRVPPDGDWNDMVISRLIPTVRRDFETIMRRAFLQQTWKLILKNWPGRSYLNWPKALTSAIDEYYRYNYIKLPYAPLQSVTSITYMNSSGVTKSMTPANFTVISGFTYNVVTTTEPGMVVLPFAQIWPTDILMPGAPIEITYIVGDPDMATLQTRPYYDVVVQAMGFLINDCFENRIPPENIKNSAKYNIISNWLMPYRIYD